jgi:predicted RNase H-like HicB family nuclease
MKRIATNAVREESHGHFTPSDSREDGAWIAKSNLLPGCHAHGRDRAEALLRFQPAAKAHLEALLETGRPIPPPFRDKFILAARFVGKWLHPFESFESKSHPKRRYLVSSFPLATVADVRGEGDEAVVGAAELAFLTKKALMFVNSAARELSGRTLAPEASTAIVRRRVPDLSVRQAVPTE